MPQNDCIAASESAPHVAIFYSLFRCVNGLIEFIAIGRSVYNDLKT